MPSRRTHFLSLVIAGFVIAAGHEPSDAGSCPNECFCPPDVEPRDVSKARTQRELTKLVAEAPEGAPIVLRDVREAKTVTRLASKNPVFVQWSESGTNLGRLGERPSTVTVLHNIPKSISEAEAIHLGRRGRITKRQVTDIQSQLSKLNKTTLTTDVSTLSTGSIREAVLKAIDSAKKDELIVLIVHNEQGVYRFSDGTFVLPAELTATRSEAPVWVIACNTLMQAATDRGPVIGIGAKLTYGEAMSIAARIAKAAGTGADYKSIVGTIQKAYPVVIGVVGLLLIIQLADEEK